MTTDLTDMRKHKQNTSTHKHTASYRLAQLAIETYYLKEMMKTGHMASAIDCISESMRKWNNIEQFKLLASSLYP